jgi:murein L,D-transpeptidase YcbB/YkuD
MLATDAGAQGARCKEEVVKASGKATILGTGRARRLAIDNWQREVRQKYGEQFMDFTKASQAKVSCESASIGALGSLNKRCEVAAYPCTTSTIEDDEFAGKEGGTDNVFTIQRFLRRAGYLERDDVDGDYGPKTAAAVRKFQRDEGLRATGEVDERTFERLRKRAEGGDRDRGRDRRRG